MNEGEMKQLVDLLLDLRDANYEREVANKAAHRAQVHFQEERKKTQRLEARLKQQESLHLTEFFARRGNGDPHEGVRQGGIVYLPPGWSLGKSREDFGETGEVGSLCTLTSPSGNQWYSRVRLHRDALQLSPEGWPGFEDQMRQVFEAALDKEYAEKLRERSMFDYFGNR